MATAKKIVKPRATKSFDSTEHYIRNIVRDELNPVKNEIKSEIKEAKQEFKSNISELKNEVKETRQEFKSDISELRKDIRLNTTILLSVFTILLGAAVTVIIAFSSKP